MTHDHDNMTAFAYMPTFQIYLLKNPADKSLPVIN